MGMLKYERQSRVAPLPGVTVAAPGGADAYGAGLGQAVEGAGRAALKAAFDLENVKILEAVNQFQSDVDKLHYDQKDGYYNNKLGGNAPGLTGAAESRMKEIANEYAKNMKNPRMREAFYGFAAEVIGQQNRSNTKWESAQVREYETAQTAAKINGAYKKIKLHWDDEDAVNIEKDMILRTIEFQYRHQPPEVTEEAMRQAESNIAGIRVLKMLDSDPMAAKELFEANKEVFKDDILSELEEMVNGRTNGIVVRNSVDAYWKEYDGREGDVKDAIYGDKELNEDQKDMVWQLYQARSYDRKRERAEAQIKYENDWYQKINKAESYAQAVEWIERASVSREKKEHLLAVAQRQWGGDKDTDNPETLEKVIDMLAGGELNDPAQLAHYAGDLGEKTLGNIRNLIESGNARDEFDGTDMAIKAVLSDAGLSKPEEFLQFYAVFNEEITKREKSGGGKLTAFEKSDLAKELIKPVILGKKTGTLWGKNDVFGREYGKRYAKSRGYIWDEKNGLFFPPKSQKAPTGDTQAKERAESIGRSFIRQGAAKIVRQSQKGEGDTGESRILTIAARQGSGVSTPPGEYRVVEAVSGRGRGNYVVLAPSGAESDSRDIEVYIERLGSVNVSKGDIVRQGDVFAGMLRNKRGARAGDAEVDIRVRVNGQWVDPVAFFAGKGGK